MQWALTLLPSFCSQSQGQGQFIHAVTLLKHNPYSLAAKNQIPQCLLVLMLSVSSFFIDTCLFFFF